MKFITVFFARCSLILLFLTLFLLSVRAQRPVPGRGRGINRPDTTSTVTKIDTLTGPTASGLTSEVKYSAEDSIRFDRINNIVYLYGKSRIAYEQFELIADYIRLDQKNNLLFAKGQTDSKTNRYKGRPIFTQSGDPPVTTDSLFFNFKTKKGKTYGTFTDVEGGYIQAGQSKKNQYNEVSIKNAIYSTCNLQHPHFGIHITRGIVTEKQIVTGPAYLVIEDIPFPIAIPFGFFPKANKRASGILFPTFGEEQERGFFLRDFGYYIGLNDYWDAELRGSIFSKGSYEGRLAARYRKNYKYDGSLNFRYASTKTGIEGLNPLRTQDFNLTWNHSQRQEANPGTTFSASVNLGTGSYFTNTGAGGTYDPEQITRNNMSSSIAYGKTFADGRMNFTSSFRHEQNITAGTVGLELPVFNFSVNSFNPFDSKNRVGEQKWYQKITFGYRLDGSNSISTTEKELFKKESLNKLKTTFTHTPSVGLSLNVLKYFQLGPTVNYGERWYLQTIRKHYISNRTGTQDSLLTDTVRGFARNYDYSFGTGLSTKVYGQMNFKKGKLVALRQVMTPLISFSYRPDFSSDRFGFYRTARGVIDPSVQQRYSIFDGGGSSGRSAAIGFSLDNNIEAKVRSKSDTSTAFQKIPILQGLTFSGSYNLVADSMKLSAITFSGRTALFKQKLGINFNGSFDPYVFDPVLGRTINRFTITDGKLARLTNLSLSLNFSLNSSELKERHDNMEDQQNRITMTPQQREDLERISRNSNAFVDFNIPWNITASYSFQYSKFGLQKNITNTFNFNGDLSITPKWKVVYSSGYDFKLNKLTYTQLSIYRDLHCWDLNFSVVPFGPYRSYSVDLRVRASILQDLKLSKRRSFQDNF